MTEEEKKELKAIVREVLDEVMSEVKPMPMPASSGPVTEISIRVMPSGAIETLGVGHVGGYPYPFTCWPCPTPTMPCLATMMPTDEKSVELLQHIVDTTGEGQDEVIRKLEARIMGKQLAEEIEKYAEEVQQGKEGEK